MFDPTYFIAFKSSSLTILFSLCNCFVASLFPSGSSSPFLLLCFYLCFCFCFVLIQGWVEKSRRTGGKHTEYRRPNVVRGSRWL